MPDIYPCILWTDTRNQWAGVRREVCDGVHWLCASALGGLWPAVTQEGGLNGQVLVSRGVRQGHGGTKSGSPSNKGQHLSISASTGGVRGLY